MRLRSIGLTFAGTLLALNLPAQQPVTPPKPALDPYAAEPLVIERSDREITVAEDGTGSEHQTLIVRVQSDATAKAFGVVSLPYASASQRIDFDYIRVHHPDGSVTETPVADALDVPTDVMRQAPFYSDLKEKQVPVRSLRAGDRLEWSARLIRTKAEAPSRFWGVADFTGKDRVALAETVTLRIPKTLPATVWSPRQPVIPTEEGPYRVYRWTGSQLDPTTGPLAEARLEAEKKRTLTPEEVTDRVDGALPRIAWTNFPDWASVGAWYAALAKDRIVPDATIKTKAAELTAGKATDEDKIRALYAFVSADIRYIGVALGQGRYQPHLASEVLGNQYGDCKDKATLLVSLLAAAGFQADTVLIGPGMRFNEAVPMPSDFNHAITAVHSGTQTIWLDSTQEVAPFRALYLLERDKQVLRIPSNGPARLDRTPADLPFASFQTFDAHSKLDAQGLAKGDIKITLRGDDEIALRAAFRQVSPAQYDQLMQYLLGQIGYEGKATHATIMPPEKTQQPFQVSFDYERDKPGDWANYRISPQFAPDNLPVVNEKEPPQTPIVLGAPRTLTSTSDFMLPVGWGATLPAAIHEANAWVKYDKTYRLNEGILTAERSVVILQSKVPADKWRDYKKFTDAVSAGQDQWINFTRSTEKAAASPGPPSATKNDPDAARLVTEAWQAITQHELGRAGKLLADAKAINAEQPYLWSTTAYRATLSGEVTEAIADYTRELDLHPTEGELYQYLAGAQMAQGRRNDAEATFRRRLKVAGPDGYTSGQLTQMLLEDEKPAEALAVAEEAAKADTTNLRLQLLLGHTRIKAGEKAAGNATLLAALRATDDSGVRNDIAYELADSGMATPEVEAASRKAVEQLTDETYSWTLTTADQDITQMRIKSNLLVASWDTLGWIIFKSATGTRPERSFVAEALLNAAWHNNLHAEVGLHLGQLQEAQKHATEALITYQLAEAATPHTDLRGVRQPPTPLQRDLDARVARLKKTYPQAALEDPEDALHNLLKLKAGPSDGQTLVVPYRILITADGVQAAIALDAVDGDHGKPDPARDLSRFRRGMPENLVPQGSNARLLRSAVLNCHQEVCEVMLAPLEATR